MRRRRMDSFSGSWKNPIEETITRYDEKGNVRRVKAGKPKKKVVTPGMYKPTKKKEHKALGHKGRNMRQKRKKEDGKKK